MYSVACPTGPLQQQRLPLKRFTLDETLFVKAGPGLFERTFTWFMTLHLLSRHTLAGLFVLAGTWHFVHPATYLAIMPPPLPHPLALVYASGLFEGMGGAGLLWVRTRRLAGWGLLALLVAVFPANVYMALIHEQLHIPAWVAWARLPLQLPLMWWVRRVMRQHGGAAAQFGAPVFAEGQ